MDNILLTIKEVLAIYGLRVLAAIIIAILGIIAAKIIRGLLRKILKRSGLDQTLIGFVTSLAYFAVLTFIFIAALGQLGIQTASFVAVLGAAGLAIGLALQGSLANFAAGVLMLIFRPYQVGDFIEGGGVSGIVEGVGIFTTELRSGDNKKIIVPNAKMTNDNIINFTAKDTRRVDLIIGVSYNDDIDKVKKVLTDIISNDERILKEPAPTIGVLDLADSSIDFAVRPWVKTSDYWNVFFHLNETIKKRFDSEGISIPFPQQDVHIYKSE